MKRGEIYFANLDPTVGSEVKKKRSILIISNDANNKASNIITILPLTSKIQCQQIRTISKLRITGKCLGKVNKQGIFKVEEALKIHLDL